MQLYFLIKIKCSKPQKERPTHSSKTPLLQGVVRQQTCRLEGKNVKIKLAWNSLIVLHWNLCMHSVVLDFWVGERRKVLLTFWIDSFFLLEASFLWLVGKWLQSKKNKKNKIRVTTQSWIPLENRAYTEFITILSVQEAHLLVSVYLCEIN